MRKILISLSLILAFFIFLPTVYSVEYQTSYELLWPLTAGKTADENGYILKRWREELRGILILGEVQKANYEIELGVKRLLEAEKLLSKNKQDLTLKILDEADMEFILAKKNIIKARTKKEKTKVLTEEVKPLLEKSLLLSKILQSEKNQSISDKLQKVDLDINDVLLELDKT